MEQLTLDFEYVINEVIRHDATWGHQFCSFSDYDIVILEVRVRLDRRQRCSYSRTSVCNCCFLLPGLPRNQPGPDQHWLAALGLPSSQRRGPASVSGRALGEPLCGATQRPSVQDVE